MSEDVGSDSKGTPQVPSAPLPSAPPPTAPPPRVAPRAQPSAQPPHPAPAARQDGSHGKPSAGAGAKGKGKARPTLAPPTQKPSYAAAASAAPAASPPRPVAPARASLVLSLPDATNATSLAAQSAMRADLMAMRCNESLASHPSYANVRVSAAKWMPKGNLVVFGGPDTTPNQLLSTSHILISAASARLPLAATSRMMACANIKWSKVLINGVPLQGTGSAPGPAPSAACHASLTAENPSYKALKVTQMPSWVRAPGTYCHDSPTCLGFTTRRASPVPFSAS